jgi:DNA-binding NtrC family response regulator
MQRNSHLEPTEAPHRGDPIPVLDFFTILIIDSEIRYRTALNANFLRHGWGVKTATGIREAFRAIDQYIFDLVICDLRMRDGDVHQVMMALDECSPDMPVIVLAANAGSSDVVRAMRNGAVDFLSKDISFDVLQVTARNAVRASGRKQSRRNDEVLKTGVSATSPLPAVVLTLSEVNQLHLESALTLARGNRTNAAKMLGISVRTVRNKIRQYGLPPRNNA